jgi:hypothetical protein
MILRSLTDSIALKDEKLLPIPFDPSFLALLDLDGHDNDSKYRLVDNYKLNWWSGRKPRNLDAVEILNPNTLIACLEHYDRQRTEAHSSSSAVPPIDSVGPRTPIPSSPDAGAGVSTTGAGISTSTSARKAGFKQILSDTLLSTLKVRNFASINSSYAESQLKLALRRASTFYTLEEAAILKEIAGCSSPAPVPASIPRRILEVNRNALSELDRLRSLPASSYKWTWGETLTKDEVLALHRPGTNTGREIHSGYDISLKEGGLIGDCSTMNPSTPNTDARFDPIPAEVSFEPPATGLSLPPYLAQHDRTIYEPLHLPAASLSSYSMNPIRRGTSKLNPAIGADDDEVSDPAPALSLAERWNGNDSESEESDQFPALTLAQAFKDKDNDSESDESSDPSPALNLAKAFQNKDPDSDESDTPPALALAKRWNENQSDDDSDPAPALSLAKAWKDNVSEDEDSDPAPALSLAKAWNNHHSEDEDSDPAPALSLAKAWNDHDSEDEDSDPAPALSLAKAWNNHDSEDEDSDPAPALSLAKAWKNHDSGEDSDPTPPSSSMYTVRTGMVVSPSKITVKNPFDFLQDDYFDAEPESDDDEGDYEGTE